MRTVQTFSGCPARNGGAFLLISEEPRILEPRARLATHGWTPTLKGSLPNRTATPPRAAWKFGLA